MWGYNTTESCLLHPKHASETAWYSSILRVTGQCWSWAASYIPRTQQICACDPVVTPFWWCLWSIFYFPAKLYSSSLSQELEHVEPDWIYAHYAKWKVSCTQSVVLSLSHVCHLYIWYIPISLWTLQQWTLCLSLYIFSLNSIQFLNLLALKSIKKQKKLRVTRSRAVGGCKLIPTF